MRIIFAIALAIAGLNAAAAAPTRAPEFNSSEEVLRWMNAYRHKPEPSRVPGAIRTLSATGALRDPSSAGVHVGFLAGIIASDPGRADVLIAKLFPLRPEDHWMVVRAIAYSGAPNWREIMREAAARMPTRRVMIDKFLTGQLPTLDQIKPEDTTSWYASARDYFRKDKKPAVYLEPNPDMLDTLWGIYFANGSTAPLQRIVTMLPWAKDRDQVEKLTLGSMAKFTLATNAVRDAALLAQLKRMSTEQKPEVLVVLNEVIEAAESVETTRIRNQAMAAIDELKRRGPGYKRDIAWWGRISEGAIGLGCVAAAATGQVAFGLPCVVGGAATSAAVRYWAE